MSDNETIQLPAATRAAELQPASFDAATNTIELCFTTGASVQRMSWLDGPYLEELQVDTESVRLGRLNAGASFLDSHAAYSLGAVLGCIVPGSARIENGAGFARVQLSSAAGDADLVQKIRDGIIRNVSVGYWRHKIQKTESDDGTLPLWRVVDWEPFEISAVAVGADPGAQVRSGNQADIPLNNCLVLRGEERPSPAASSAQPGVTSMSNAAAPAADPSGQDTNRAAPATVDTAASRALIESAIAAERSRSSEIATLAIRHGLRDFGDEHVRLGTDVAEFRTLLLDKLAARTDNNGPRISTVTMGITDQEKRGAAIQEALVHRYDQTQPLTDAGREFRGLSLLEMGRDFLEASGVRTRGMSRMDLAGAILTRRADDGPQIRGAGGMMTTSDFTNVLANVANKTLRQGYEAAGQTFRPFVRVVTVPDFKQVSRVQLGEAPQLEKVAEHGEFRRGKIGDAAEKYSIATYGKVVAITRQVIINDDLSAFTRVPRSFGVAAANLESDLVWAIITGNPNMADGNALFHASHKNLGTGAAIDVASVGLGRKAMRSQVGLDGKTLINVMPTFLIGPTALQTTIEQFLTAITPAQISNVVPESLRKLTPITEPRLDAASASNWYMAADPNQIDTIELAYLEGQEGLYTETRTGFDVDGIEIKVREDVGAKAIDWRGFYKNPN